MSQNLVVNNVTYPFPDVSDQNWGQDVTDWATAVTGGMLQKAGGSFTLTAEVDFGASFGLKSLYVKSRGTNPASAGIVRLANTETISWRNAANGADVYLSVSAADKFDFNGSAVSAAELGHLSGVTSAIQTQINAKAPTASPTFSGTITTPLTASRALVTGASSELAASAVTATELGCVSGVTSAIQTQLDAKVAKAGDTMTGNLTFNTGRIILTTASSSSGGPAVNVTEADTADAVSVSATNASFNGNAFIASTTRAANSAFNFLKMVANSVNQFVVDGAGAMTAAGALTLTPTSNQLILGATRTVTITAPTPASSSRTWTIPDISGNGTFAALEGTQTFSGAKTFSSAVVVSASSGNTLVVNTDNLLVDSTNHRVYINGTSAIGTEQLLVGVDGSVNGIRIQGTNTSGTPDMIYIAAGQSSGTIGSGKFLVCNNGGTIQAQILGNGNLQNINNSYGATSDEKIKESISDATPKLDDLCRVRIRNFTLKNDQRKLKQIGVIAQELEPIFPGLVETGVDGLKGVKYSVFVPIIVKGVQELRAEVQTLQKRIADLEQKAA